MNTSIVVKDSSSSKEQNYAKNNIIEGSIGRALLSFFFPIVFGTFFQQLYNTVDAVVVGRFVGKEALAAVGGGAATYINLLVGFFVGLSSGAGVLISQFYGGKNKTEISRSVHTAIAMCIYGALILMVAGILCSKPMMVLIKVPEDVMDDSTLYLRVYFCGMIPMLVYNMGASILRAVGDSRTPVIILVIGCFSNIILDILLVVIFKMGVLGVALATVICQIESAWITLHILGKTKDTYRFEWRKCTVTPHILRSILRIGFPAGIQSVLYTVSNLIIQTNINTFGTNDVAAWAAYGKIDSIFWMLVGAFGVAVTTFAGQNYGAQQYDRVKKANWITLALTTATTFIFSAIFWFGGPYIYRLFTDDQNVIDEGMRMLRYLVPFYLAYISIEVLSGTMRGVGSSFIPMMITVFGVCGLRILWLFTAARINHTIYTVMASYPITWAITSLLFWIYYASGKWLKIIDPRQEEITSK